MVHKFKAESKIGLDVVTDIGCGIGLSYENRIAQKEAETLLTASGFIRTEAFEIANEPYGLIAVKN